MIWFKTGSKTYEVEVHKESLSNNFVVKVDNQEIPVAAEMVGPSRLHLSFDHYIAKCAVVKEGEKHFVFHDGEIYELQRTVGAPIVGPEIRDGEKIIRSPMPGRVIDVLVEEGQEVEVDQDLIVIEAMKMETRLTASLKGTVKSIVVKKGDQVDADAVLVELEPIEI